MKQKNTEIIKKTRERICYRCNGKGYSFANRRRSGNLTTYDLIPCPTCKGTGFFKENYYILISGKFAIGMDSIK